MRWSILSYSTSSAAAARTSCRLPPIIMWPSLGGSIKRCILPVCPSVRLCAPCLKFTKTERRRTFTFSGDTALDNSNWRSKFELNKLKVKVNQNENAKNIFYAYLRGNWIDLHQTNTKLILGDLDSFCTSSKCEICVIFLCMSVCLSVICLSFTQNLYVVESAWSDMNV